MNTKNGMKQQHYKEILFAGLLSMVSTCVVYCEDSYKDGDFIRSDMGLIEVPDDIPDAARLVNLNYNELTELPADAFNTLSQCRELHLSSNRISVIAPGAFNGLASLEELRLSRNNLSTLAVGTFNGVEHLQFLDISYNFWEKTTQEIFSELVNLETLFLSGINISVIGKAALSQHHNLDTVAFGGCAMAPRMTFFDRCRLPVLRSGTFRHMCDDFTETCPWGDLDLSDNYISELEPGAFAGLVNLGILTMISNSLSRIGTGIFVDMPETSSLNLDKNTISDIEPGAFEGIPSLTWLVLDNNNLGNITAGMFRGLTALEELSLVSNNLVSIDFSVLADLPRPLQLCICHLWSPVTLLCNSDLCWLKQEEMTGSVKWCDDCAPLCAGAVTWKTWTCASTI